MKTAKRIQLLLSPVLIAMLALMLAVVSFGWYMAEFNGEIEVEDSSVNITVEAPEYIDVQLTEVGDNYEYENNYFTIKDDNPVLGYFGQTGEYEVDSTNNDRPYIMFYEVKITANRKYIDVTSAYVDGLDIVKNEEVLVSESNWVSGTPTPETEEVQTKFKVCFYTKQNSGFTSESSTFNPGAESSSFVTYMGVYFDDPVANEFAYSDFHYYGSTYKLHLKFI